MAIPLPRFSDPSVMHRLIPLAVVAGLAGLAVMVTLDIRERGDVVAEASDEAQIGRISGPPCPPLTTKVFLARGLTADKTFDFGGLVFSRRFGHVQCAEAPSGDLLGAGSYPVCQFTSPDILVVKARDGVHLFEPGLGKKASVMLRDGKVSCVMSAPYWAT